MSKFKKKSDARARLAIPARGLGLMHNAGQRPAAQTMQAKDRLRKWVVGRYSRDREMTYIFDAKLTDDAWRSMLTQTHNHTNTRVHPPMYEGEDRGSQAKCQAE